MDNEEAPYPGASAEAIRAHYDVGNDFYRLWLDETMTYSAAMWRDERDTSSLADAQRLRADEPNLHRPLPIVFVFVLRPAITGSARSS